jgi:NADPH-dependent curcumin reductase CurA
MSSFQYLEVKKLSSDFRAVTEIMTAPIPTTAKAGEVVLRTLWAGINASDVNWTAGKYIPGMKPPFGCGFESIAEVVTVGEGVKFTPGQTVLTSAYGAFSEYQVLSAKMCVPIPTADVSYLPLRVNGLTALAALEECAQPKKGEVALVTAAAGGTGQFAVQLLKHHYGCHVIGTCSGGRKAEFLKNIGCDRVIDYKVEDVSQVLKAEYRTGVNLVYESVGGKMFDTALDNLSLRGKLIVIGSMSGYKDGSSWAQSASSVPINTTLLQKSASIRGFFLPHYVKHHLEAFNHLTTLLEQGKIKSHLDHMQFRNLESVPDAVDYLQSGQSIGKVVVHINFPEQ